jgi:hypothetical protein
MNIKGGLAKIEEIIIPPRRTQFVLRDPLKPLKEAKAELGQELAFEARS